MELMKIVAAVLFLIAVILFIQTNWPSNYSLETTVNAKVISIDTGHLSRHKILFVTEFGETLSLEVSRKLYKNINVGDKGELKYKGSQYCSSVIDFKCEEVI